MRILGIDPGTGILGFGVIDADGDEFTMVDAGVIRTKPHTPQSERLKTIHEGLEEIISENKPTVMSVEKLFFSKNITTAMTVSEARGVCLLMGEMHKMKIFEYNPMQIKQAITGYGGAEKSQIQEMVKVILKLKKRPTPDDCADALAAAICHAMSAKLQ